MVLRKVYSNAKEGLHKETLSAPILFCIAEEVLSRGIHKLVAKNKFDLITASRNVKLPYHCFYADDLMVYCKGKMSGLEALKELTNYANCSGQIMNLRKSSIHAGGINQHRLNNIVNLLGFSLGSLPFTYHGAPIFKGTPKRIHFQSIADKVKIKLESWKASLLSIGGRIQLVKVVVQSMLLHTMSVYSWPISLLIEIEKWIKNFIWSGDITKNKIITMAWKKICASYEEGGLNIRSLVCLNEATNLKLLGSLTFRGTLGNHS